MARTRSSGAVRGPAVAGSFYPDNPANLRREVQSALARAPRPGRPAQAVIAPHAGYLYSGAVAARAVAALGEHRWRRIILLGPAHTMSFSGAALPDEGCGAFATPLGEVELDREALACLAGLPLFRGPGLAHAREHCLEVELPLLQVSTGDFLLVPVLVGSATTAAATRDIARHLARLVDAETAVVVSSDFTHHGRSYGFAPFPRDGHLGDRLLMLGRATADRAAAMDPRGFLHQVEVSGDSVCGAAPVHILLELLAHGFSGTGEVLEVTTSAAVSGTWDQVVTYAAVAFHGQWQPWRTPPAPPSLGALTPLEGEALTALGRATLGSLLRHDESLAHWFAAHDASGSLLAEGGVFVSLHRRPEYRGGDRRLRGCIGTIEPRGALVDAVIHNACAAARDPRFPPLEANELPTLQVEVSVLSPFTRVVNPTEIVMGHHGVLLSQGNRRALFLPQVATETGWDRECFLSQLSLKAGLPGDAWHSGAELQTFSAQVFAEPG